MSVLIRGMKIPDNCKSCAFSTGFGFCLAKSDNFCGYTNDRKRPEWCPLVEVPEPHGRLIDADALDYKLGSSDRDIYVKYTLEEEPTVIEAEDE